MINDRHETSVSFPDAWLPSHRCVSHAMAWLPEGMADDEPGRFTTARRFSNFRCCPQPILEQGNPQIRTWN